MTKILNRPTTTPFRVGAFLESKGAHPRFVNAMAPKIWWKAKAIGIDPRYAIAQVAKETGFGHFTGQVPHWYHNPCGLKIRNPVGDRPQDHKRFKNWDEGITAYLTHVVAYLGKPKELVDKKQVKPWLDPRWELVSGKVTKWEELGGRWAPNRRYGVELVKIGRQI